MSGTRRTQILEVGRDPITGAHSITSVYQSAINKGDAFTVSLDIGVLATTTSVDYHFKTPENSNVVVVYMELDSTDGDTVIEVRRGTEDNPLTIGDQVGDEGDDDHVSIKGLLNINDIVDKETEVFIGHDPTYVDDGGALDGETWEVFGHDYIMKVDTSYTIRVTNEHVGDASNDVKVTLGFIEF